MPAARAALPAGRRSRSAPTTGEGLDRLRAAIVARSTRCGRREARSRALLAAVRARARGRARAVRRRGADPPDRYTELSTRLHPSVVLFTMQIPADDRQAQRRSGTTPTAAASVVASGAWGSRILTDAHVIDDARNLRATLGDTGKPVPAHVIARQR